MMVRRVQTCLMHRRATHALRGLCARAARWLTVIGVALGVHGITADAQSALPRSRRDASAPSAIVMTHVTVVDVETGQLSPDLTVVVSGQRITAIGPSVRIPAGARVIDARGKFLIPGLWDMHTHALDRWPWSSLLNVANGVTGVRDPGAVTSTRDIIALRGAVERGDTLGPRIVASGTIIDGAPKSRRTYVEVVDPDTVRAEIARRQRAGLDFIKVYTRLSRDVFLAAATEARRLDIPLVGHVPLAITAAEASDAGMRSIEHAYRHRMACATGETEIRRMLQSLPTLQQAGNDQGYAATEDSAFVLGLNSYDAATCRRLGERFARNGTWFVPTLVEMQTRFVSDYPLSDEFRTRFADPRLRYVSPAKVIDWRTTMALDAGILQGQFSYGPRGPDTVFAERAREVDTRLRMAADLHRGGASLLAGTDTDTTFPFLFFGFSLHDELALLVKAGLTPLAALQSATLNPARFLKREAELGTVSAGKLADLVLLDANPLENIEHTRRIAAVVVNGRYLSRAELNQLLDRAADIVKR
jgi:imidazolonepropionase-like amidohydrolase